MASPEKRCLYEVLNLPRDCTADEIRSAYRKLALQRHPDKLIKSGIPESEATASFQELVNAYEVLSDARERAWYDSHRSQILFSGTTSSSSAVVPDLFTFFSNSVYSGFSDKGKGFYKVYGDVFDKIYMNELNYAKRLGLGNVVKEAPVMGNLESVYEQVNAFYGYWLGFVTVMDFVWADEYDVMSGPNRKSRRLMEEENKKIRKRARREYIETVRGLAEFVKKRDKRVIDMQMKRSVEMEKKREEERVKKAEMARLKAERARAYEEPEWAKVDGELEDDVAEEEEEEGVRKNELYCVACGKKFKSDKQWKNHEQSRKHKDKVAELREAFGEEDQDNDDEDEDEDEDDGDGGGDADGFVSADEVEKLKEQFEGVEIQTEEKGDEQESQSEEEFVDVNNGGKVDLMEYNNVKGRRKRRGRKETAKRDEYEEEQERIDKPEISSKAEVDEKREDGLHTEEPSCADNENNGGGDDGPAGKSKVSKQAPAVKVTSKKEAKSKAKNLPKGKKQKATSRNSGNECDTCGADFDSRTKLHKHLNDTGHATIKSR
ncbi:putative transcription factor C2H2 family [Helianthus annuus]|nr:putative transcription factor C2H2 family [Helianthus annuus]